MAELFLARAPAGILDVERAVVLKVLPAALAGDAHWLAMFYDEARLAARLDHPNLVRVLDLVISDGRPHIVMEYVDGRDLRQVLRRAQRLGAALPPPLACYIVSEALAALSYAHSRRGVDGRPLGLVHRDVSPSNLMLTFAGGVKLIDFGIAKAEQRLRSELTGAGQFKGKCAYSAPEQVRCGVVDARTDLFAAGIVLWELLTRRRLFARGNDLESLQAIANDPIPPVREFFADVPAQLEAIVELALARDPRDRYATAADMRADLLSFIRAEAWLAGSLEVERFLRSLFSDGDVPAVVDEANETPSGPTEVETRIEVRLPDRQTLEVWTVDEMIEIDVVEPSDVPTAITPLPEPASMLVTAPENLEVFVQVPPPAHRSVALRRRWSRALVVAAVALGVLGAAFLVAR